MTTPAEQTSQAQEQAQGQEPTQAPTPADIAAQQPTPTEPPVEPTTPNSVDELPDWAQSEIRKAREEAAKYRTRAKDTAE